MSRRAERVRGPKPSDDMPKIVALGQRPDLFGDFYHSVLQRSWTRHLVGACAVFLGANALFAALYSLDPEAIYNARPGSFEDAFYFSVQTMSTIGYGTMAPATRFANVLVTIEALFGTLLVAVLTGITFARFARPTAKVLFSNTMVIAPRDGVPHLMVRMANWRHNNVVEAYLKMFTLHLERTQEGETIRVPVPLTLVRDSSAVFWMSWTAMHRIDERSPLYGPDGLERLRRENAEIFLIFTGRDETFSTTIHARTRYKVDDIVDGARFVDILTLRSDGTRVIDYRKFHQVEPAPAGLSGPPGSAASRG
jgi:inward rectifier potassium channel